MHKKEKNKSTRRAIIIVCVVLICVVTAFLINRFFFRTPKNNYSYESLRERGLISDKITEETFNAIKEKIGDDPENLLAALNYKEDPADKYSKDISKEINSKNIKDPLSSVIDKNASEKELEEIYLIYTVEDEVSNEYIDIIGTLEVETRQVISKVSADILELFVEEGDYVTENSTIAILDNTNYQINYLTALNDYEISWDLSPNERKLKELQLQLAEKNLDYTIIRSPINGIISSVNVNEGEMISNENAAVSIVDYENVYVSGVIDEIDMNKINEGMNAIVSFPNYQISISGKVSYISPVAISSGGVVIVPIKIELDENPYDSGIISGVSCDVAGRKICHNSGSTSFPVRCLS